MPHRLPADAGAIYGGQAFWKEADRRAFVAAVAVLDREQPRVAQALGGGDVAEAVQAPVDALGGHLDHARDGGRALGGGDLDELDEIEVEAFVEGLLEEGGGGCGGI